MFDSYSTSFTHEYYIMIQQGFKALSKSAIDERYHDIKGD